MKKETKQRMADFKREIKEEAKELKKEAENSPCKKCGKINWELTDTITEPFYGWEDIIYGEYKCLDCDYEKTVRIQNPN